MVDEFIDIVVVIHQARLVDSRSLILLSYPGGEKTSTTRKVFPIQGLVPKSNAKAS
jgi:hypothetical protein